MSQSEHPVLKKWLLGTTCYRHRREVMFKNTTHIILRHFSHPEYLGGWDKKTVRCGIYAALYKLKDAYKAAGLEYNHRIVKRWDGRLYEKRIFGRLCKNGDCVSGSKNDSDFDRKVIHVS